MLFSAEVVRPASWRSHESAANIRGSSRDVEGCRSHALNVIDEVAMHSTPIPFSTITFPKPVKIIRDKVDEPPPKPGDVIVFDKAAWDAASKKRPQNLTSVEIDFAIAFHFASCCCPI